MTEFFETLNSGPLGIFLSTFLGLIWGSFFNVCIYRLPSELPVHRGRSICPHCKKPIPWYLNVPVLGYLFLNGKTQCCRKRLSPQYPLVELGTAITYAALYLHFGFSPQWVVYAVLCGMLWIISVIDLYHRIIPDELSLSGIVVGFMACLWTGDIAWWHSLLGAVFGGGLFFLIAWGYEKYTGREGLGGGDVKMLAMLGAWFGPQAVPLIILISTGLGSIVGVTWMATSRRNLQAALPFGPFLATAAVVYLFWGERLNEWLILR